LFPVTGVTLPFISYGGTSIIVFLSMAGILLNISRQRIKKIKAEINE
jgi:cell division protein FtsW